ncbi:MAG: undecaprenyl-diphosphatase UppP [Anaerolineales bacterium]|jgi:undecaprenyl-diphosphatase
MTVIQSIILGIIQGITEFLPISSSGHLVIVPYLLGWDIPDTEAFVFNVLVQVASLFAVIFYFWSELLEIGKEMWAGLLNKSPLNSEKSRLGWLLILATIPAGLIGFILRSLVKQAFASPIIVAFSLLLTAGLLLLAEVSGKRTKRINQIDWWDSLWIGLFQVLAVFPGVSRSGATISAGMMRDLKRPESARFAFLMSVPIMLAAGLSATYDLIQLPNILDLILTFLPGFISSAIAGYISIRWLLKYLAKNPLIFFALYCAALSIFIIVFYLINI